MKDDLTLLIFAGGMGSRFGGLKQLQPVGKNGEFIIDYSIYDAVQAGFNKVVFAIKKEQYDLFEETVGQRVARQIKVDYSFESIEDLPKQFEIPPAREKLWGTASAVLKAGERINEKFAIINADDFYGREAFVAMANYLRGMDDEIDGKKQYAIVGYRLGNTLTENGTVKRGVCWAKDGYLERLSESVIEQQGDVIVAKPLDGSPEYEVEKSALVAVNMMLFSPSIFEYLEKDFIKYLEENRDNLEKCEYLIPQVLQKIVAEGFADVKVIETDARWLGITYREDLPMVVGEIAKMVENGTYPENLWSKEKTDEKTL